MLLFGPRWLVLLPLVFLLPVTALCDRRMLIVLLLAACVVAGPLMGVCINRPQEVSPGQPRLRVLTCNVEGKHLKKTLLAAQIAASDADVVALQECPSDGKQVIPPLWYMLQHGEFLIGSRYPLQKNNTVQSHKYLLAAVIKTPLGDVTFCTVHLPSTRFGLVDLLDRHTVVQPSRAGLLLQQTAARRAAAEQVQQALAAAPLPVVVAGDFNALVEGKIYREFWSGYRNAFSTRGFGYGWTERVLVAGIQNVVRIDHVLVSDTLRAVSCAVGTDVGSDHLPLIADVALDHAR